MTLFIIFLILTIIVFVGFLYEPRESLFSMFFIFLALTFCSSIVPYYGHISNLVELKNIDTKIKNTENMKNEVSNKINVSKVSNTSLMNADSPYKTMYESYIVLDKNVLEYKNSKVDLLTKIEKSEKGLFSFWCLKAKRNFNKEESK